MPEARAYLGDGRLELDNNICERSIRPVAPGRKNCLFLGSVGGGEAAAIAYALIETAEMNNVDPEAWLTWVLERIADHRLTPSTNLCRGTGSPKTSKTRPDRTDTFQEWLSGPDHLSPAQRQQTEAVFPGDTETSASLAAIEAAVGGRSPVPALWHARRHIAWQGKGAATVPVQRMQEDIQCRDRHPLVGSAPQGQVAFLRSLSC